MNYYSCIVANLPTWKLKNIVVLKTNEKEAETFVLKDVLTPFS